MPRQPAATLLADWAIDGPKGWSSEIPTIRRRGNQGAGAIVGFANLLLRLYEAEQPRAVLVGWDTLDAPTYRHHALEGYQGGAGSMPS
jgi:5'-3' exonuclease